jgi:hypothetical protein
LPTPHPKLRIAQARPGNRDAVDQMVAWLERDRAAGEGEVRVWLKNWIPEYAPPGGASVPIAEPIATMTPAAPVPAVALFARRRR